MKIIGIAGPAGSGKTTLIRRLIPELRRRGLKVAVAKHCPHGFDLEREGKDSWRFARAGAAAVAVVSPDRYAVVYRTRPERDWTALAERIFPDVDVVLVEGGRSLGGLRTVEIVPEVQARLVRPRGSRRIGLIIAPGRPGRPLPRADVKSLAAFLAELPATAPRPGRKTKRRS